MFHQKIKLIVFLFLTCLFHKSFSQISVSPTVGCAPLNGVSFSGPAGATAITWNFGDASTSNLASPSHNYTSAGNFIVTYNATVGGLPVTGSATVVVYGKPTASFTYIVPPNHCKPLNVSFNSTSSGSAAISSYTWNFGDGGQINGSNGSPNWSYILQGSFFASLIITDANGCVSNLSAPQGPINVSTPPTAIISSNPLSLTSCTAPFTAAFSGSNCVSGSPIVGPLNYSWNFGNSQTSTQETPGNTTYNTQGLYTVSLTVTDNNNCSSTVTTPVSVSQPSIAATIPATVCLNTAFPFSYQTNQPFSTWYFGVGTPTGLATSSAATTFSMFTYSTPGLYTINISAGSGPCMTVQTKTIFVEQVIANFTHTPASFTCSPTFTASYINLSSSNATSFTWTALNYGGVTTTTSAATNPTFTFVQGSLNPYTIYNTYSVNVSLIAQSASGCKSTFTINIFDSIKRPTAWFNTDKVEGCAPLVVKFRDSSFTSPIYPITSYTWNNGASTPIIITGTIPPAIINPTFTYSSPGTYTPFLIVQTASGCIHTSYIHTITVVNPPVINFTISPGGTVCWNTPITVTATSTSTTPIQHWHVNSDNGYFSHCINNSTPTWLFTHIGVHTFSVDGYSHSCKGTSTSTQSVLVKGPIAQARFETNCIAGTRKTVKFVAQLQDVANGTLNFGDNSTVSFAGTPNSIVSYTAPPHTYSASGNYTAVLTTTNNATGCSPHTYTMLVKVRDAQANFSLTAVGCTSVSQTFNASPSIDVFSGCNKRGYIWYVDNLPPIDTAYALGPQILIHTFATAGTHTVLLMVKDENSCLDTTKHTIRISSANPTFSFSSSTICLSSGTVQMVNSTAQTPDPVTNYIWDFGDGSPLVTTTVLTSPIHTYLSATTPSQNFTVTLTATNSQGCTDVVQHILTVVNPVATLSPSQFLMCIPNPTNLAANTILFSAPSSATSYTFNFGDGSSLFTSTNNVTPLHTYTAAGSYTASVIVDVAGCKNMNTVVVNAYLYPIPNFSLNPSYICKDNQVQFTNTSTVSPAYTLNWNLGTGSPILPNETVVWTYTTSGIAIITLTVSNGCAAVVSKTLNIYSVKGSPILNKTIVCLGNAIQFSLKNDTSTVESWDWDFGDGSINSYTANASPSSTISHIYSYYPLPSGNTFIQFTAWSSLHRCFDTTRVPIKIIRIDADFDRNNEISKPDSVHCLNVIDNFTNQTPNSSGYNFNWAFGNGSSATGQNPSYTYPMPGSYQVTLTVTDPINNCLGYTVKNMTINALPNATVSARDTCKNRPFILNSTPTAGTPPYTYSWTPSAGVVSPTNAVTSATSSNSTTYTLNITDANGCKNNIIKNVYIQLPADSISWDTTVVVGQIVPLNNNSGSNFTYTWNPITDLSCTNCPYPVSNSTVNVTYSVTIADNMGCFRTVNTHTIIVELKGTVDVPTAFTPNGDGINDVIYVDGWGIRKLNYFRIFNRWGQLLFESNDIKIGWDGMFNGVPQNMETYVYQVSADAYVDAQKPFLKTGTFKLIR